MKNFRLTIEYDGSAFHGWQIQPDCPTIQDEIQKILSMMTKSDIIVSSSGRTDAGVHALAQVAHFTSDTTIAPEKFLIALNSMLPPGILIKECAYTDPDFHARFSARQKTYRYRILNRHLPVAIGRQYLWHIRQPLDLDAMERAAAHLLGSHDFKSFEGSGSPRAHTIREIYEARFERKKDDMIEFTITGNGFLKFMVRNIVGTLAEVGLGKIGSDEFKEILGSCNRDNAGPTAPPQGLFLMNVEY